MCIRAAVHTVAGWATRCLRVQEDATRDKQHDSSVPEGSQNEQESQGGEASGEGDTFKPGQWTPGGS